MLRLDLGSAILIFNSSQPWFVTVVEILFYIYIFLAAITGMITPERDSKIQLSMSSGLNLSLTLALILQNTWRTLPRPLSLVGPVECLEVFALMLAGSVGSLLCSEVLPYRPDDALTILLWAIVCQGLGFFISLLVSPVFGYSASCSPV